MKVANIGLAVIVVLAVIAVSLSVYVLPETEQAIPSAFGDICVTA